LEQLPAISNAATSVRFWNRRIKKAEERVPRQLWGEQDLFPNRGDEIGDPQCVADTIL